jgi:hypothetical protein
MEGKDIALPISSALACVFVYKCVMKNSVHCIALKVLTEKCTVSGTVSAIQFTPSPHQVEIRIFSLLIPPGAYGHWLAWAHPFCNPLHPSEQARSERETCGPRQEACYHQHACICGDLRRTLRHLSQQREYGCCKRTSSCAPCVSARQAGRCRWYVCKDFKVLTFLTFCYLLASRIIPVLRVAILQVC